MATNDIVVLVAFAGIGTAAAAFVAWVRKQEREGPRRSSGSGNSSDDGPTWSGSDSSSSETSTSDTSSDASSDSSSDSGGSDSGSSD